MRPLTSDRDGERGTPASTPTVSPARIFCQPASPNRTQSRRRQAFSKNCAPPDLTRDEIIVTARNAVQKSSRYEDSTAGLLAFLEEHGRELYTGADDLVLMPVYLDATTSGAIRTRGEFVVPGSKTIERYPACGRYGLHFRKTFTPESGPLRRGETPAIEFERTQRIRDRLPADLARIIEPLAAEPLVYRSRAIAGATIAALSPFTNQSYEDALVCRISPFDITSAGRRCEAVFNTITDLHAKGIAHQDLHLENVLWLPKNGGVAVPIDFGAAGVREQMSAEEWRAACADDLTEIVREAGLVQARLNRRLDAPVFRAAIEQANDLFPTCVADILLGRAAHQPSSPTRNTAVEPTPSRL